MLFDVGRADRCSGTFCTGFVMSTVFFRNECYIGFSFDNRNPAEGKECEFKPFLILSSMAELVHSPHSFSFFYGLRSPAASNIRVAM